jgi:hypothetical protein
MENSIRPGQLLNVKDEREFKLWLKFILSVHNNGGNTDKPIEILWQSVKAATKPRK